jgi:hypothetical protein
MSSSFNHVYMPNVFYPLPAATAQQPPQRSSKPDDRHRPKV